MTKAQQTEKTKAIAQLREWLKPGDTVYTILDSVSRSGMTRHIRCLVARVDQRACDCHMWSKNEPHFVGDAHVRFIHPNHAVATVLNVRQAKSGALIVGGAGMDMGFHVVYELSCALFDGDGYALRQERL